MTAAGSFRRPRLADGALTIGAFAPSGVLNPERLAAGIAQLQSQGHRLVIAPEVSAEWRYFAGTDEERLDSFHRMLADPSIEVMMMARGGYGWSRLMHRIDWDAVREADKAFIGFSDFTAFQLGALARSGRVTYAGPGVATDFDWRDETPQTAGDHAFMNDHCWPVLRGRAHRTGTFTADHAYPAQVITGPIWGSNLSLLSHLVGTPYMPAIEGGIVFVEEIGEQPYAIERMFLQLFHAGILQKQKALILGDFTDCEPEPGRFLYTMQHVAESLREWLPYPVLTGLPFGHVARKLTLPFGAPAALTIDGAGFALEFPGV